MGVRKLLILDHQTPHSQLTNLGETETDTRKTARNPQKSVEAARKGKKMSHLYG
jgi:hypothetical protein